MTDEPLGTNAEAGPVVPAPVEEPVRIRQDTGKTLYLARWLTRFWAWLIDFILVILFLNIVDGVFHDLHMNMYPLWDYGHWEVFAISIKTLIFFLYWTIFESYHGQSVGKMVMNIRVVNRDGTRIHWTTAAIESLGKAFLPVLCLDCLIGWFAMPNSKLRMFNRISNTIVIKTDYKEPDGVLYVREKE
jgi:uncharacterized RDD family membrane protein YckC